MQLLKKFEPGICEHIDTSHMATGHIHELIMLLTQNRITLLFVILFRVAINIFTVLLWWSLPCAPYTKD